MPRYTRHHTRKGPGRLHMQGALHEFNGVFVAKAPKRRYPAARYGGNWQGKPYLSYMEHDMIVTFKLEGFTPDGAKELALSDRPHFEERTNAP